MVSRQAVTKQDTPISQVISSLIAKMSSEKTSPAAKITEAWAKAVGKKASRFSKPAGFKQGRLVVNVAGSSWMYDLNLKKQEIITRLNEHLKPGRVCVKVIILRIGDT